MCGQISCAWVHGYVCVRVGGCQTRQSGRQTESSSESFQIDPVSTYHKGEDKEIISKSKVAYLNWYLTELDGQACLRYTTVSRFFSLYHFLDAQFSLSFLLTVSVSLSFYLSCSIIFFSPFLPLLWIFSTPLSSRRLKYVGWAAVQLSPPQWAVSSREGAL